MDWSSITDVDYLQLFVKVICGLVASSFFLYLLFRVYKPKLAISKWVCTREENIEYVDDKGNTTLKKLVFFEFKIVNLSRYNAYDVRFHLNLRTPYIVNSNKVNHSIQPIPLRRDYLPYIPKYNKEKGVAEHAILLGTTHDLLKDINEKNLDYELTVIAKHGLSNMTSVAHKRFESKSYVKIDHEFIFGKSLDVKEV